VARYRDAIRLLLPHYWYGGTLSGTIYNQFGDTSQVTLSSGGEVLGKAPWPEAQFTVPPGEAEYELRLKVRNGWGNPFDTSTSTDTTWTFRSSRPATGREVLPLLQATYHLETDAHNAVPSGTAYPLRVTPGYQPGVSGPAGFEVTAEVSYDDGETWSTAPVRPSGDAFTATVPAADSAGFGSLRVVVTDADGNSLEQRIDRGWRVAE
jgi:hypothetical protein